MINNFQLFKLPVIISLGWMSFSCTYAASFDCTAKLSNTEKAICENYQLNIADEEMSAYYLKLRKTLNFEESKELLHDQKSWLKQRKRSCREDSALCLLTLYAHRIDELKQKYDRIVPLTSSEATSYQGIRSTCGFPEVDFPETYKVYGAGNYAGRDLGIQIDSRGTQATKFDIAVNSPDQPVALVLGAYESAIWNISWTQGTKILAVAVTGYDRQVVIGLPSETPILISRSTPCRGTYIIRGNIDALNQFSKEVFKRDTDAVYLSLDGKSVVGAPIQAGEKLFTSEAIVLRDFIYKKVPKHKEKKEGLEALQRAVADGKLSKANGGEREEWRRRWVALHPNASSQEVSLTSHPLLSESNTFVIRKKFRFPTGLTVGNMAVFYLPDGVPFPKGKIENLLLYDLNTMSCYGTLCGFSGGKGGKSQN